MVFLQYLLSGFLTGGIYGLIGLGIVIVYKSTKVFNFAVGALMTFCALICVALVNFGLPAWAAILVTFIFAAILGGLTERLGLRPLLAQPILTLIMATLAIQSILYGIMVIIWEGYTVSFPAGLLPGETIFLGPLFIPHEFLYAFVAAVACFVLVGLFFFKTQAGLRMRVTAESHDVAMALGVNITRVFSVSWMLATVVGALAGIFIGNRLGLQVAITPSLAFKALPAIIFGGLDSVAGAIIGGFAVGILEKMAGGFIDRGSARLPRTSFCCSY
jgi:branched-chain amino acid transport system permease protein